MRTLLEIVEAIKNGEMGNDLEYAWAILALDALLTFDHHDLRGVCFPDSLARSTPEYRKMIGEESFRRSKDAFARNPQKWVGWENDPSNPDYQARRKVAFALLERFERGER